MGKRFMKSVTGLAALGVALAGQALAQNKAEKRNMELVGYSDLQGRSAYQPVIHKQASRWIAYIGHHGDNLLNPLTGKKEDNGTDRKSTRLNSSHLVISYAVFCLKKKNKIEAGVSDIDYITDQEA